MKLLNNKIILKEINPTSTGIPYVDKEEVKTAEVVYDVSCEKVTLTKGDVVYYQYGNSIKLDGVEYILVNEGNLLCLK